MTASTKIMARLMSENKLEGRGPYQYMAYQVMIGELAQNHDWQSILRYDKAYRTLQAQCGFIWGADVSHLRVAHIEKLTPKSTSNPLPNVKSHTPKGIVTWASSPTPKTRKRGVKWNAADYITGETAPMGHSANLNIHVMH